MISAKLYNVCVYAFVACVAFTTPASAQDRPAGEGQGSATGDKAGTQMDRLEKEISDGWITTQVQSKFYLDDDVKGLQIDVTANGGVVTLTGKVGSAAERQKALSLTKSTDGVKQVIDKLTVGK